MAAARATRPRRAVLYPGLWGGFDLASDAGKLHYRAKCGGRRVTIYCDVRAIKLRNKTLSIRCLD